MKIYVRRRHIKNGKPQRRTRCPIALAFEELTGERPYVDPDCINTRTEGYVLPRSAQRFISRFDSGKPVKPFAFTIRA
jgi:hypothetical protein